MRFNFLLSRRNKFYDISTSFSNIKLLYKLDKMIRFSFFTLIIIMIGFSQKIFGQRIEYKKDNQDLLQTGQNITKEKNENPPISFFDESEMSIKIYKNDEIKTLITLEDSSSGMGIYGIWSPDGTEIMFRGTLKDIYGAWVINTRTKNLELFFPLYQYEGPKDWTEKAGVIANMKTFDNNSEIYILQDSTNYQNLTNNKYWDFFPTGHPDGRVIFWSSRDDPTRDKEKYDFKSVYAVNPDGTNLEKLFEIKEMNDESVGRTGIFPDVSPNGEKYVFTLNGDIYLINLDGTEKRNITNTRNIDEYTPSFSNEGDHILFTTSNVPDKENYKKNKNGKWEATVGTNIFKIDIDGKNRTQITFGEANDFSHPRYKPAQLTSSDAR